MRRKHIRINPIPSMYKAIFLVRLVHCDNLELLQVKTLSYFTVLLVNGRSGCVEQVPRFSQSADIGHWRIFFANVLRCRWERRDTEAYTGEFVFIAFIVGVLLSSG